MSKAQINRSLREQEQANRKISRLRRHGTRRVLPAARAQGGES
ncbi:hypothetical protein [Burkholderia multivorans]|nr:hypothetical protein [Burkholderia multivorans]